MKAKDVLKDKRVRKQSDCGSEGHITLERPVGGKGGDYTKKGKRFG